MQLYDNYGGSIPKGIGLLKNRIAYCSYKNIKLLNSIKP